MPYFVSGGGFWAVKDVKLGQSRGNGIIQQKNWLSLGVPANLRELLFRYLFEEMQIILAHEVVDLQKLVPGDALVESFQVPREFF